MQFSVLQTRLAEETGLNVTSDATKIKSWLNEAYKFICALQDWPWLIKTGILQTVADITTLTASVDAGGTTVTLSDTYASSLADDYMIKFPDISEDWYNITAHTAGTDELTIAPAFVDTDALAAGDCIIRKVYYSLAADVDRLIGMHQAHTDVSLKAMSLQNYDKYLPDPTETGTPEYFAYVGLDSSKYHRITLYPVPSEIINIPYRYYQRIVELSDDADVPLIPDPWHQAIVFVALASFGHPYIDDDRVVVAKQRADRVLASMMEQISVVPGHSPVIQPWDRRRSGSPSLPRLPNNYPYPGY